VGSRRSRGRFGLLPSDEVDSPAGFAAWVARLIVESDPAKPLDADKGRCTYRWIVEGDRVLGGIALRHGFSDFVRWAGHIGYGIRPSARRRGLATWALGRMLDQARALGLDQVLLVCAVDNAASVKTIERHGGVLEDIRDTVLGQARRYWIKIADQPTHDFRSTSVNPCSTTADHHTRHRPQALRGTQPHACKFSAQAFNPPPLLPSCCSVRQQTAAKNQSAA
jgi:predicted acetyltransferase